MTREQYLHIPNCTYTYIMSATDCTTNSMNTRMQIPLPHVPTKDVALSRYIPKATGMGRRRRRSRRRSRGGGRPIRYDDGLSPGIWNSHPYIRTTRGDGRYRWKLPLTRLLMGGKRRRRRHRSGSCPYGGGRSVGSGIGDILSKGLQTVAKKGSKLVKEEATKHGSKIASSIHKKGSQLLRQGTAKAKSAAKTKVQSALKSIVNKKAPSVKRLQKAVQSITNATSSRKRSSSSSTSHRRRKGRRRRRSNIGISRRSRIGLSEQSLFGLL